ncbi:hypothetical protein ACLOJK_025911 [Asimina triloba]
MSKTFSLGNVILETKTVQNLQKWLFHYSVQSTCLKEILGKAGVSKLVPPLSPKVGSGVGLVGICLAFVNSCKQAYASEYRIFPYDIKLIFSSNVNSRHISKYLYHKGYLTIRNAVCVHEIDLRWHTMQVILSDGDLSSLVNLKLNLEMNQLQTGTKVDCKHLPWESASASELQDFSPDVVLGADVIYDPSCMPHLVQVLTILLARKKCYANEQTENYSDGTSRKEHIYDEVHNADDEPSNSNRGRTWGDLPKGNGSPNINKIDSCKCQTHQCHGLDHSHNNTCPGSSDSKDETVCGNKLVSGSLHDGGKDRPVAYIATVIRNADTFDYFLKLANQTGLIVVDITERQKPLNLLPYMLSYERSSIRLYVVYLCD